MDTRIKQITEENTEARAKREYYKKNLHLTGSDEANKTTLLEVKTPQKHSIIKFNEVRRSKFEVDIKNFVNNIHISQQQQEQQQQQQQIQLTQQQSQQSEQQYEFYPSEDDLINLNKNEGFARYYQTDCKISYSKLKKLLASHQSQTNSIGYVSFTAAKFIDRHAKHFVSGLILDDLPDGFKLFNTKGNRTHENPLLREATRLVLHYDEKYENKNKTPFTINFYKPPLPCAIKGTAAQFDITTKEDLFALYKHSDCQEIGADEIIVMLYMQYPHCPPTLISRPELDYACRMGSTDDILRDPEDKEGGNFTVLNIKNAETIRSVITKKYQEYLTLQQKNFIRFMEAEDYALAKKITATYSVLFLSWQQCGDYAGLWDIFYHTGCTGIKVFFELLQKIYDKDTATFLNLKKNFFERSNNWLEFFKQAARDQLTIILNFTPHQLRWWNELSTLHVKNCDRSDLTDLLNAFDVFRTEYIRLGSSNTEKPVDLPTEIPQFNACNMKIVMKRLLNIMTKTRNFQDQVNNLHGLDFNSPTLDYALTQKYRLVASCMELDLYKYDGYDNLVNDNKISDVNLKLSFEELNEITDPDFEGRNIDPNHIYYYQMGIYKQNISSIYKYIGTADYGLPLQTYVTAFHAIANYSYSFDNGKEKLEDLQRDRLFFIVTTTTTHERGLVCELKDELTTLMKLLPPNPEGINNLLLLLTGLIAQSSKNVGASSAVWITLSEVITIAKIYNQLVNEPDNQDFLNDMFIDYKKPYVNNVIMHYENKQSIALSDYVNCLKKLEDKTEPLLCNHLPRIFSIIRKEGFHETKATQLIDLVKQFKKINPTDFKRYLSIVSNLKIKSNTDKLPTIDDFIVSFRKLTEQNYSSLLQHVTQNIPSNCTFNSEELPLVTSNFGLDAAITTLINESKEMQLTLRAEQLKSTAIFSYLSSCMEKSNAEQKQLLLRHAKILIAGKLHVLCNSILFADNLATTKWYILIHDHYYPAINESHQLLLELDNYCQQVEVFTKNIKNFQSKWPTQTCELLKFFYDLKPYNSILQDLNYYLEIIMQQGSDKKAFPFELLTICLEHGIKKSLNLKLVMLPQLLAAKNLKYEHKLLLVRLNLQAAGNNTDCTHFINGIFKYYDSLEPHFALLISIIEFQKKTDETTLRATLFLTKLVVNINQSSLTEKIFFLLSKYPSSYLKIIAKLANQKASVVYDVKQSDASIIAKEYSVQEMILQLIFQNCDFSEFNEKVIYGLIDYLSEQSAQLPKLLNVRPPPTIRTLVAIMKKGDTGCQKFFADPTHSEFYYRNLMQQFDTSLAVEKIRTIKAISTKSSLPYQQQRTLLQQFILINKYGHDPDFPIFFRKIGPQIKELTAKDLTAAEIKLLVTQCRKIYKADSSQNEEKENARLVFIALICETLWRETGKFPYSTQVIALLIAVFHPGHILEGINTGQGKSIWGIASAANLWFEGGSTIGVVPDEELARVAVKESSPVFAALGIRHRQTPITMECGPEDFYHDGINYGDTAAIIILLQRMKHHRHLPLSMFLDECDRAMFDDTTHYRRAIPLYKVDLSWIYRPILAFVASAKFKDKTATINDDINNLRQVLTTIANESKINPAILENISPEQMNTWIESAIAAPLFTELETFKACQETRGTEEKNYPVSFARIIDPHTRLPVVGPEWSNGVQQFLHAHLNQTIVATRKIPEFPIDPETIPVDSMMCEDLIEYVTERGKIIAATGSPPETAEELEITVHKHQMEVIAIPSHQPKIDYQESDIITNDQNEQFTNIIENLLKHLRQNESLGFEGFQLSYRADYKPQPVLIAFNTIKKSQTFYDFLLKELGTEKFIKYKNIIHTQLLNGDKTIVDGIEQKSKSTKLSINEVIARAGVAGWLTVSTIIERGPDIKPRIEFEDPEQNHPNGLFVVQAYSADIRTTKQLMGRKGRKGGAGQGIVILEKNEMELYDQNRLREVKNKIFIERLRKIKSHFCTLFREWEALQKDISEDIQREWGNCLNKMDSEWPQLLRVARDNLTDDTRILIDCTKLLIENACQNWNKFSPIQQQPEIVISKINLAFPQKDIVLSTDSKSSQQLAITDVSPSMTYVDCCPLTFTTCISDIKDEENSQTRIEAKRCKAAWQRIEQVLGGKFYEESDSESLKNARLLLSFTKLFNRLYPNTSRLRELLREIFAVAQWSKSQELQQNLREVCAATFADFTHSLLSKDVDLRAEIPVMTLNHKSNSKSKKLNELEEMITFLKVNLAERKSAEDKLDFSTRALTSLSSLLKDNVTTKLEKLLEFIDHPFTRSQLDDSAHKKDEEESDNDLVFVDANPRCTDISTAYRLATQQFVLFPMKKNTDREVTALKMKL